MRKLIIEKNKDFLIETRYCDEVKINLEFFKDVNISDVKTLETYAKLLNTNDIYSNLNKGNYNKIFTNLNKCLIWPKTIDKAEILFNHDNYTLLWKIVFEKNKPPLILTMTYLDIISDNNPDFTKIVKDIANRKNF